MGFSEKGTSGTPEEECNIALYLDEWKRVVRWKGGIQSMSITGKVCMVLENRPAPIDTRVWPEAKALQDQGFEVCLMSPKARTSDATYRCLEGIHLYAYPLPTISEHIHRLPS